MKEQLDALKYAQINFHDGSWFQVKNTGWNQSLIVSECGFVATYLGCYVLHSPANGGIEGYLDILIPITGRTCFLTKKVVSIDDLNDGWKPGLTIAKIPVDGVNRSH